MPYLSWNQLFWCISREMNLKCLHFRWNACISFHSETWYFGTFQVKYILDARILYSNTCEFHYQNTETSFFCFTLIISSKVYERPVLGNRPNLLIPSVMAFNFGPNRSTNDFSAFDLTSVITWCHGSYDWPKSQIGNIVQLYNITFIPCKRIVWSFERKTYTWSSRKKSDVSTKTLQFGGCMEGAMTPDFMKSRVIAPLLHSSNWIVLVETFAFIRFWVDFTWNPLDFMKSARLHEIRLISCEIERPLARNCNPMFVWSVTVAKHNRYITKKTILLHLSNRSVAFITAHKAYLVIIHKTSPWSLQRLCSRYVTPVYLVSDILCEASNLLPNVHDNFMWVSLSL